MLLKKITLMMLGIGMAALLSLSSAPTEVSAQKSDSNERGKSLYMKYCASCHGADAKGNGPAAEALKAAPTDLTMIAKNKGKFDGVAVLQSISGEVNIPAHGSKEMPVWGEYFRRKNDASTSKLNVYALTKYLESIQQK